MCSQEGARLEEAINQVEEAIHRQTGLLREFADHFHAAHAKDYLERARTAEQKLESLREALHGLAVGWERESMDPSVPSAVHAVKHDCAQKVMFLLTETP